MPESSRILVTGATGYIGGRLIQPLLDAEYTVRVMTRDLSHLQGRSWLKKVEAMEGDVLDTDSLSAVLEDIDVAYYLIHSMSDTDEFKSRDKQAAENFARTAASAGVKQIIYLGGLGSSTDNLSPHLESRQEVGEVLRQYHSGVTEFRAAMIIGSGSLSFELIRSITERLPLMIAPKWLYTRSQPIGIQDVLSYLIAAIRKESAYGEIVEIGGADILSYHDMVHVYARARDMKRFMIPVPVLTPHLSSYWIHMVTPISASIIRPLIEGLRNETIVTNDTALELFPDIEPQKFAIALQDALNQLKAHQVETSWTDSMAATWEQDEPYTFVEERGMLIERRVRTVDVPRQIVFDVVNSLGGKTGWLYLNSLWHIRGWMDRLVGGPGYRRGRPDREIIRIGDAIDFWRVEAVEPGHLLRLRAEMKMPGKGWLQFEVETDDKGQTRLIQTAYFAPKGLFGYLYWYSIYILHKFIFDGMIDRVVERAKRMNTQGSTRLSTNE